MTKRNLKTATDMALEDPERAAKEAIDEFQANLMHDFARIADAISEAVGPETDINGEILDNEYLVPFLTSKWLGLICWAANRIVDDATKSASGLANRGLRLAKRFQGSEVEDLQLQENNHRVNQRLHQVGVARAIQEACRQVYAEQTGRDYGVTPAANDVKTTMARLEAEALAKSLGADTRKQPDNGRVDRRPAIYTDRETGERFALNAEGQYEPIGKA